MKYIKRHMENVVLELSKSWPVILLTGPRQAGKTTMLRALAEQENAGREYVSLDDLNMREMAKTDPKLFLQLHKPPVLIDEAQYAPELFTYIKIRVDEHHNPGDFWLTGSQIFRLMQGVQESLAGRVALLHMSPLSQREIIGEPCIPFTTDFDTLAEQSKNTAGLHAGSCLPGLERLDARSCGRDFSRRDIFIRPTSPPIGCAMSASSPAQWTR